MRVDEVVIISLPDRTERLEAVMSNLPRPWPFPFPRMHDGVREQGPEWFRSSDGAWGCRQAHLQVLNSAWRRGVKTTLVLEDDAVFTDDFAAAWSRLNPRIPPRTDMLMLGGQHVDPPVPVGDSLVRCTNTRRTHAYIVALKAVPMLMRVFTGARRHIDHALCDFQAGANVYAPTTFLVGQGPGRSDISGQDNTSVRFWT